MKKKHPSVIMVLAAIVIFPTVISAQNTPSIPISSTTRDRLRAAVDRVEQNVDVKLQNVKANADTRNNTIEERQAIASSTRAEVGELKTEARENIKNASTTGERREIRVELRKELFKIELNRLVNQLNLSLRNMEQIRSRIESRIEKATAAGKDMSQTETLLVMADGKVTIAKQAIESLKAVESDPTTVLTAGTSTIIKLEKPRQYGANAIKAVNEVRVALNAVVVSIARGMGVKLETSTSASNSTNKTNSATTKTHE